MRCRATILFSAMCGLVTLAVAVPVVGSSSSRYTEADNRWVFSHFNSVLKTLLPIDNGEDEHIGYRVAYDFLVDAAEYSFVIEHTPLIPREGSPDVVRAYVRMADTNSIYRQMLEAHASHPQDDLAAIERGIRLRTWKLSEATCPAIRLRFAAFQEIHFKAPRLSAIRLDVPTYEIEARSGAERMKLSLDDSRDPAVVWASETADAFAKCGADINVPREAAPNADR